MQESNVKSSALNWELSENLGINSKITHTFYNAFTCFMTLRVQCQTPYDCEDIKANFSVSKCNNVCNIWIKTGLSLSKIIGVLRLPIEPSEIKA